MKNAWAVLGVLAFTMATAGAQDKVDNKTGPAPDKEPAVAVTERGPHHKTWERVEYEPGPGGKMIPRRHVYHELATGMHYQDEKGQWLESEAKIEILPKNAGAIAAKGQHKVIFPLDVYDGQIELNLPDGSWLRSRVLGLSYIDSDSGKNVLIAEVTNSIGEIHGDNVVLYPNAFTDFQADLRYTYTREGFEQDVVLRGRIPLPEEFGLNPKTTRLQVLTEFFNPPAPIKTEQVVAAKSGDLIPDQTLSFGATQMGAGKAFPLADDAGESIPVGKQWQRLEGRDFLIEEVQATDLLPFLDSLPKLDGASLDSTTQKVRRLASLDRQLPAKRRVAKQDQKEKKRVFRIASAPRPRNGFVLDYVTINTSLTNYVFQGGATYYLSGNVSLYGTNTTFEPNTVIKYATNVSLTVNSPVTWLGDSYRPVFLLSKDDNSAGETVSGSTGSPGTSYYAATALYFNAATANTNLVLQDVRVANATRAVSINTKSGHVLKNVQLLNCANGLSLTNAEIKLRNALFYRVMTNFTGSSSTGRVEHLTSDIADQMNQSIGSNLFVTNSVLIAVTNKGTFTSYKNYTNTVATGIFQTIHGGSHYLINGSTNRGVGTASIDATLFADLKRKTTCPPLVYTNVWLTNSGTLLPRSIRDNTNSVPDLGFHYDALDYVFGGCDVTNNLTFAAGTAVGWFRTTTGYGEDLGYALRIGDYQTVNFSGLVTSNCYFAHQITVQEGLVGYEPATPTVGAITGWAQDTNSRPNLNLQFTKFSLPAAANHIRDAYGTIKVAGNHCEFYGGGIGGYVSTVGLTNSLLYRCNMALEGGVADYFTLQNCTALGAAINIHRWPESSGGPGTGWVPVTIVGCAFEGTSFLGIDEHGGDTNWTRYGYNAYLSGAARTPWGSNDVTVTSFNWCSNWLGRFYLPTNSTLINVGNATSAGTVGLYHFTTQTNQVKETNSVVDIGYHYVALNASGQPFDFDGDGTPDYLEDKNGNGILDAGETEWRVVITNQPQSQTVSPGGSVTFTVGATGTPLYYRWLLNGTNVIANATNSSLTFNPVSATNAGVYSVIVSNANGLVISSNATLTVTCLSQPSGLVAWWQGESSSFDSVSNHLGYFVSGSYTNGYQNKAFRFDGANSYMLIPDAPTLKPSKFTIEAWVYPLSLNSGWRTIYIKRQGENLHSIALYAQGGDSRPTLEINTGAATAYGTSALAMNQWSHLVGTYNGTNLILYVNGVQQGNQPTTTAVSYTTEPVFIGGNNIFSGGEYFDGRIDEVALYNRALSATEVANLYLAGSIGKCPPTPRIIPSHLNALVGNAATFSAVGSGASPLSYQWSFNSTNLAGATNAILAFNNLQKTAAGSYSVVLSNSQGAVTASEALLVNDCYQAVDVVLVVDRSGSMTDPAGGGLTRIQAARMACTNFVQNLDFASDRVGLVSFATDVTTDQTLTNSQSVLLQKISQLTATTETYMGNALLAAHVELTSSRHNTNALPILVFLTDGEPDDSTNSILSIATQIKNSGTHLITVGLGTNLLASGLNLLRSMASTTNNFYQATNVTQLTNVYSVIADSICRGPAAGIDVAIVTPTNGFSMVAQQWLTIGATASSGFTNISWVQFLVGTNGNATNSVAWATTPTTNGYYEALWYPLGGGTYTLLAKAQDARGSNAVSAPVTVTVHSRPTVTITNPVSGSIFGPAPTNLTLRANASAIGASVTNVSYYDGTNLIASSTAGPSYSVTWNVGSGEHTLRAKVFDSLGVTAFSPPVNITVLPSNAPPVVNAGVDVTVRLPGIVQLGGVVSDDGLPLGSVLTVTWTNVSAPSGATVTFSNIHAAVTYASFSEIGYYTNRLIASDGQFTTNDQMIVLVLETNLPPIVDPGTNQVLYDIRALQLQGWVEDDGLPTNSFLTSTWEVIGGPGDVAFANASATNCVAVFSELGAYTLRLTASDGELTTSSNIVVIVTTNVVGYRSSGYHYRVLTNQNPNGYEFFYNNFYSNVVNFQVTNISAFTNEFKILYTNFYALDFDDSNFSNGQAAYGNSYTNCWYPIYPPATEWPNGWPGEEKLTTLLVRKWFVVPPGTTNLSMGFMVDDGFVFFLNGKFVDWNFWNDCPKEDSIVFNDISPSLWHEGTNLLAVWAYDAGGMSFFDVKIGANRQFPVAPPSNNDPVVVIPSPDQFVENTNSIDLIGFVIDTDEGAAGTGTAKWRGDRLDQEPGEVYFEFNGLVFTNQTDSVPFTNLLEFPVTIRFSHPGEYQISLNAPRYGYDSVYVTVYQQTNTPPVVTLITPTNNSTVPADVVIPVSATATTTQGSITNVEFFAISTSGAALIGHATNTPYAINWLPGVSGNYILKARAFDDEGFVGLSSPVAVQILSYTNGNHSPKAITDRFTVLANSANNIRYPLDNDTDADGNTLTITEIIPAHKAQIVQGGKAIMYTPPSDIQGYPADGFSYRISDGKGGTALGSVYWDVFAGKVPEPWITYPAADCYTTNAGRVLPLTATIDNTPDVVSVEFFRSGISLGVTTNRVGSDFTLNWIASYNPACNCPVSAQATDRFGQVGTSPSRCVLIDPPVGVTNPVVSIQTAISSLATNAFSPDIIVTIREGIFDLYGRAYQIQNSNIVWTLGVYSTDGEGELLRELTPPGGATVHVGNAASSNLLARCDLSALDNGLYEFRLTATAGYITTNTAVKFRLESNLKIGQFGFSQQDLAIPVNGIPLTVIRTYNSINPRKGDFGYGWTYAINGMDVELHEERENIPNDFSIIEDGGEELLSNSTFSQRTGGNRDVTLTLPDGQRTTFTYYEAGVSGSPTATERYARWTNASPAVTAKLEGRGPIKLYDFGNAGGNIPENLGAFIFWEGDSSDTNGFHVPYDNYDFLGWTLTTLDGTKYIIDREDLGVHTSQYGSLNDIVSPFPVHTWGKPKLARIEQVNGDVIRINADSIEHWDGDTNLTRQVKFVRNDDGLIIGVSDPASLDDSGNTYGPLAMRYEYDSRKNLINVLQLVNRTNIAYVTNSFAYTNVHFPHYITSMIDARGITVARNEYDEDGRLTAVTDANGKTTRFYHNTTNRMEVITDRMNHTNTYVYDSRGNVKIHTNALNIVTIREYDDAGRETWVTNALGSTTETWSHHAYDQYGNATLVVNSGHTNRFIYDARGNLLSQTDPVGNITTNIYNSHNNLIFTAQLDPSGTKTNSQSSAYYVHGQLQESRNALNQTTATFHYNPSTGDLANSTDANGVTRFFGYDRNGNQTGSYYNWTNPANSAIFAQVGAGSEYDAAGRVVKSTDPLGNSTRTYYNAGGKVDYTVDKFGNTNSFLYDARGNLIQTTSADGLKTQTVYDDSGRAILTTDRNGVTGTETIYDAAGRVTSTIRRTSVAVNILSDSQYPALKRIEIGSLGTAISTNSTEYFDSGWVKSRTGPDNKKTTYAYWPDGQTMYVTNSLGQTTFYKYDTAGRQEYVADALNRTNRFEYDGVGRMVKTIYQNGTFTTNIFNNLGQRVGVKDQADRLTQFAYDLSGQLTNVIKPDVYNGATGANGTPQWAYSYDMYGRLHHTTDPMNHSTTNSYDEFGREVSRWLTLGGAGTTNIYNQFGQVTNRIDFKGQRMRTVYDRFGRVATNAYFAGLTNAYPSNLVCYYYNQLGQLTNITERWGTDASSGYIASVDLPNGRARHSVRAVLMASLAQVPPGTKGGALGVLLCGLAVMAFFNAEARRRRVPTWQIARTFVTTLRLQLFSLFATGGEGRGLSRRSFRAKADEAARSETQFRSLPSAIFHLPFSLVMLCSYAAFVLRCGGTPDGTPRRFRLPSFGWRLATIVTLIAVLGSDPHFDSLWTARAACDTPANPGVSDNERITIFTYDLEGRLAQVNTPEGVINYEYDLATGRHLRTCTGKSELSYQYDDLGRLWKVNVLKRDGAPVTGETITYEYTEVGSRKSILLPNGVKTSYAYDELNRLTGLTNRASDNSILSQFNYQVDATGRRTNAVEIIKQEDVTVTYQTNTLSWAFDGMYRLTNEVCVSTVAGASYTNAFQYDLSGNRWQKTRKVGAQIETIKSYYNANDQLLREEITELGGTLRTNYYAYDANGSVVAKTNATSSTSEATLYGYDLKNKLSSAVTLVGSPYVTNYYRYNESGIRVRTSSSSGGNPTLYLVDGNNHTGYAQVLEELSARGNTPDRSYVLGEDVLAQTVSGTVRYLQYDGHGSTRQLSPNTANANTVTSRYNYDAYGTTLGTSTSTPQTSLLYCGEQYDSTLNMYNLRARFYDPTNGRFVARDTFRGSNEDPQSLHKYAYCPNLDPVNGLDPSGNMTLMEIGMVVALIGIIAAASSSIVRTLGGGNSWANRCEGLARAAFAISTVLFFPHPAVAAVAADEASAGLRQALSGRRELTVVAQSVLMAGGTPEQGEFASAAVQLVGSTAGPALIEKSLELLTLSRSLYTQFITGRGGAIVLGRYPNYTNVADQLGANALSVPSWLYKLTDKLPGGFWRWVNKPFIDAAIARGDTILISDPIPAAPPLPGAGGQGYWDEIEYLYSRNFRPTAVGDAEEVLTVEMTPVTTQ